jgi:hypothetical protein
MITSALGLIGHTAAHRLRHILWAVIAASAIAAMPPVNAENIKSQQSLKLSSAEILRLRHAELEPAFNKSPFNEPLLLSSTESSSNLAAEVYAVINHPFATVEARLKDPEPWCDVLILHLNIKFCRIAGVEPDINLVVHIGSKREQELEDSYQLQFNFNERVAADDYFQIQLNAPEGPLSTRNFRIMLEATPASGNRTFLHFTYSYDYGFAGRMAMKGYLATIGHDKVGFTSEGVRTGEAPSYVNGVRGLTERNTMRYYLAIDAYIKASTQPSGQFASAQFERSLDYWFSATERFPRQLREIDRSAYFDMKRREYTRQNAVQ